MQRMFILMVAICAPIAFSAQVLKTAVCPAYNFDLPVNNSQVLHWKRTTKNQFRERGHVSGVITEVYPNRNGHRHFSIRIGSYEQDTIEVIYNEDFGRLDKIEEGMRVKACGDYITSTAQSGPYPRSPDDAIIHWVHMNPADRGHLPGYLEINGKMYGQEEDRRRRH